MPRDMPETMKKLNKSQGSAFTRVEARLDKQNWEGFKSSFNLCDPSRQYCRQSLISDGDLTIESEFWSRNFQAKPTSQLQRFQNEIIISLEAVPATLQKELNENQNEQEEPKIETMLFQQVLIANSVSDADSMSELKPQIKKSHGMRKSNAIKNFANRFLREFKNQTFDQLKQKYNLDKKSYKNMMDNLNKRIKYEKRCLKMVELQSMIAPKNKNYSPFLHEACEKFLKMYPQVLKQSKLIRDESNINIIKYVEKVLEKTRDRVRPDNF